MFDYVSKLAWLVVAIGALSAASYAQQDDTATRLNPSRLQFDVAESGPKFVFDEAPVFPDSGLPAYGNAFVTQGYIYPYGTLSGGNSTMPGNGINPDGSPEFPELVIGEWTCRGYFIGNGVNTAAGPWVITTQHYDFYDAPGYAESKASGERNLVSEGYELIDIGRPGRRAITGGTGPFSRARGESSQILLGFNASEGVNLRFEIRAR
jgi:hypothetical protein